jgi:phosphatidate phosphatase APP1
MQLFLMGTYRSGFAHDFPIPWSDVLGIQWVIKHIDDLTVGGQNRGAKCLGVTVAVVINTDSDRQVTAGVTGLYQAMKQRGDHLTASPWNCIANHSSLSIGITVQ